MKKKVIIAIFLCLLSPNINAQSRSNFGGVFTAKGDLRILIILAQFEGSLKYHNQDLKNWTSKSIEPDISILYKDSTEFYKYKNNKNIGIISKFFYQMSLGKFRIYGDYFCDSNQNPVLITINPNNINSWQDANTAVLKKLNHVNPDFDFSNFDNRKNRLSNNDYYRTDNSIFAPDGIIDFVVIMYKYSNSWPLQPGSKNYIRNWSGSEGGFSRLSNYLPISISFGGKKISNDGFTLCNPRTIWSTFVHEINHELLSMPHYLNANSTAGNYFYKPTFGMGMISGSYQSFRTALALERWLLGWTDIRANKINSDIGKPEDLSNKGEYRLRDFVSTGDAIRIRIPFPKNANQFIWLENHQKLSIFDDKNWKNKRMPLPLDPSAVIPESSKGIYIYTEGMQGSRDNMQIRAHNMNLVNSIKIYNAQGNFDYRYSDKKGEFWGHGLRVFSKIRENPISGINPFYIFVADLNGDGRIESSNNFNNGRNEGCFIALEEVGKDTLLTFSCFSGVRNKFKDKIRSDAFIEKDVLNMYSNPIITNIPRWSEVRGFEPIYLNGLQISIINKEFNDSLKADDFLVRVEFGQNEISNNVNWAGKVYLPDITNDSLADLVLKPKVMVNIAQNFTPTRTTVNRYNSFSDTSIFRVLEGAKIKLNKKSKLVVEPNCSIILDKNSILELDANSKLILKHSSHLIIRDGSIIRKHKKAKIIRR